MNSNMLFHFIGIGGISMSALAVMLSKKGFKVQGSNLEENDETAMLQTHDIHIFFDHKASNIENADVVVYNSAIGESNPELAYAKEKGLLILTRAQMLASISKDFENCIAICGSHGKTTTTSMIAHILTDAGKKPTVHVGGVMRNYNSNFLIGDNKIFVTEACEYKNNFHALSPSTLVVLNIEADHLDFFKTFSAIEKSFQTMVEKSQSVVIFSDTNLSLPKKTVLFCTESHICNKEEITLQDKPTLWASNLCCNDKGWFSFDCNINSETLGRVTLGIPCEHNVSNALSAIATCLNYGVTFESIQKALTSFRGVKRRFEIVGNISNALAVHDYAHHPTEISCTIRSAKSFCKGKVWVVFQPHTYSRTKSLMSEFVEALVEADEIIILPTYPAREEPIAGGDASDLSNSISKIFPSCIYASSNKNACEVLDKSVQKDDIVLLLGAGSIVHFYDEYKKTTRSEIN